MGDGVLRTTGAFDVAGLDRELDAGDPAGRGKIDLLGRQNIGEVRATGDFDQIIVRQTPDGFCVKIGVAFAYRTLDRDQTITVVAGSGHGHAEMRKSFQPVGIV